LIPFRAIPNADIVPTRQLRENVGVELVTGLSPVLKHPIDRSYIQRLTMVGVKVTPCAIVKVVGPTPEPVTVDVAELVGSGLHTITGRKVVLAVDPGD
jgi:hypothetical protein